MYKERIFNFRADISGINIPGRLNNPFERSVSEIAVTATTDFQQFLSKESKKWAYDFSLQRGKMFGVLVVQKKDKSYGYLGTISGKIPGNETCRQFVPSVFDTSTNDFFIDKGMTELTEISKEIKGNSNPMQVSLLIESRKRKSFALQQQLFENYRFLNLLGQKKNVAQIFKDSSHGNPPSAAGECAAPKLLQYAFKHALKPIAIAEFWWGKLKNLEREHLAFYPACKNKCRPILEYMLNDYELYSDVNKAD